MGSFRFRWPILVALALATAAGGLFFGKAREREYLAKLYGRHGFTLLDDQGNFFTLSEFPSSRLLLLVFTPDSISPDFVKPFWNFSRKLEDFRKIGVDVFLVSRTNREVVRNFKEASGFRSRLLLDVSGTVGRLAGVWPDLHPVSYWSYALVDHKMRIYWADAKDQPLTFEEILKKLRAVSGEIK